MKYKSLVIFTMFLAGAAQARPLASFAGKYEVISQKCFETLSGKAVECSGRNHIGDAVEIAAEGPCVSMSEDHGGSKYNYCALGSKTINDNTFDSQNSEGALREIITADDAGPNQIHWSRSITNSGLVLAPFTVELTLQAK